MKEFIEKLIGRLEEWKSEAVEKKAYYRGYEPVYNVSDLWSRTRHDIDKTIEIANQLAEEYKNDFCEWRLCDEEANIYDTTCRNPHILIEGSPTDNNYEFCPYCGKKIKVVE